jgi:hypothetical protein
MREGKEGSRLSPIYQFIHGAAAIGPVIGLVHARDKKKKCGVRGSDIVETTMT